MEGINIKNMVSNIIGSNNDDEQVSSSTTAQTEAPPTEANSTEAPSTEVPVTKQSDLEATKSTSAGEMTQSTDHTEEVVNTTRHSHTTEEVEHQREVERHQNIVNVVEQPLKEEQHVSGTTTQHLKPTTEIEENHAAATEDNKQALGSIAQGFEDPNDGKLASSDKTVVDKGETVNETVHTHVQNVVVPVVDKDVHEHNTIKTFVPTHQVINEAPIIQKSSTLEPVSREEYEKTQGGDAMPIESLQDGSILSQGESERKINGVEHGTA